MSRRFVHLASSGSTRGPGRSRPGAVAGSVAVRRTRFPRVPHPSCRRPTPFRGTSVLPSKPPRSFKVEGPNFRPASQDLEGVLQVTSIIGPTGWPTDCYRAGQQQAVALPPPPPGLLLLFFVLRPSGPLCGTPPESVIQGKKLDALR